MTQETTHPLDYEAAFDRPSCRSLLSRLLALNGCGGRALRRRNLPEPGSTYRLVARAVALEAGFDSKCVAAASGCTPAAVAYAPVALRRRMAGEHPPRRIGSGFPHPLGPVLERARAEAEAWRRNGGPQ